MAAAVDEGLLLEQFELGVIDEEELLLLANLSKKRNPSFPYYSYEKFDINNWSEEECWNDFRFHKNDLERLASALNLPAELITYNRMKVPAMEALCFMLRRLAYPCRYSDLISRFARPVPELSVIFSHTLNYIYDNWGHLLSSFNQPWLSQEKLRYYADTIYRSGSPLDNCWGFIDGTTRKICRPEKDQKVMYNGHKRVHAFKYQSVIAPNGLIANFYGPLEGSRHDSYLLAKSGLLNSLDQHSFAPDGSPLCIYGDPAYPLSLHLQTGFKNAILTDQQHMFNERMSSVRVSVEWGIW